MTSPSIYVAENYIYRDKSYSGSFPIYMKDTCAVASLPQINLSDLDEEKPIVYSEDGQQGFLYTF